MLLGTRSSQHHTFTHIERFIIMISLLSSIAPYLLTNPEILNLLSSVI